MIKTQGNRETRQRFGDLYDTASEQALEFSTGRIREWRPGRSWRRAWLWSLLAAGCAAAIASELCMPSPAESDPAGATATPAIATHATAPSPRALVGLPSVRPVRWIDETLRIDIERMPVAEAARQLAEATGSVLTGDESLPSSTSVTLHGSFSDVLSAWHRLLKGEALYQVDCGDAGACRVAITGSVKTHPGFDPSLRTSPTTQPSVAPPSKQLPGEAESQPDGAC